MNNRTEVPADDEDLLSLREVMAKTSLGRSTLYRLVGAGKFPKPRQVTEVRVGWRRGDVRDWCRERPVAEGVSQGVSGAAA